jgi:hypothetical protein
LTRNPGISHDEFEKQKAFWWMKKIRDKGQMIFKKLSAPISESITFILGKFRH